MANSANNIVTLFILVLFANILASFWTKSFELLMGSITENKSLAYFSITLVITFSFIFLLYALNYLEVINQEEEQIILGI